MFDIGEIVNGTVSGVVVAVVVGIGALLFRFLSSRVAIVGKLWQKVAEQGVLTQAFFVAGVLCAFAGFLFSVDSLVRGGIFLAVAGFLYALLFRESSTQQTQSSPMPQRSPSERMPASSRSSNRQTQPDMPATGPATNSNYNVGDTAPIASRGSLTVHSYESSVPPPEYMEPDAGKEYSAIEVEWCAGPQPGGEPENVRSHYFELQMPDNTRVREDAEVREPALSNTTLLPNDCVRGWITFQTPLGQRPSFVVFTDRPLVIKWAL